MRGLHWLLVGSVIAGVISAGVVFADDLTSTSFIVRDPVMTVEGGRSTSASFQYLSATGETIVGESTGAVFQTRYGFLHFSVSSVTQRAFRWYENINAVQPTTAKAAENTGVTSIASGDILRLRIGVQAAGEPFAKDTQFKLQFAELGNAGSCSAIPGSSFADVGAIGSGAVWRGYDNAGVGDGASLPAGLLSTSAAGSAQTYEEANSSGASPSVIGVGENADAEWDWVLQNNGGSAGATYCFRQVLASGATLNSYHVYPSATIASSTPPPSSPSGGSGGSGGATASQPVTQVIFRGKAYPGSLVTILKDGQQAVQVPASPDANFDVSVGELGAGTYTFGVLAVDDQQHRSLTQAFTVTVTAGTTTVVSGIFLPPTIAVEKTKVAHGEPLGILGKSVPNAEVTIVVHSQTELLKKTASDASGAWFYKLDTLPLEEGDHATKARAQTGDDISSFSRAVAFRVGEGEAPPVTRDKGDLNNDGRVNLVDFSIAAYWYRRPLSDAFRTIESTWLNGDGKIDLIDFSIMAYYWTG